MPKDILIVPNPDAGFPYVEFNGLNSGDLKLEVTDDGNVQWVNATNTGLFIENDTGNVGIHRTTVDEALHVGGNLKVDGDIINDGFSDYETRISAIEGDYVPTTGGIFSGDLGIQGNLDISGTTTTINSNTVNIGDSIITLNSDYEGSSPLENGGLEIERGTLTNASMIWDEANDVWKFGLVGSETQVALYGDDLSNFTSDLTTTDIEEGDNLYYTNNRVGDHLIDVLSANEGVGMSIGVDGLGNLTSLTFYIDFSDFTTDDIIEGTTNLFFTDERVDDRVASLLTAGSNVSLDYDDVAGSITINSDFTNTTYSAGTGISLTNTTFSHGDTSTASSVSNSTGTVISGVSIDEFGHTIGFESVDLDGRYYTETEVDGFLDGKSDTGHLHDDRYLQLINVDTTISNHANVSANTLARHDQNTDTILAQGTEWEITAEEISTQLGDYVDISGDTMTGDLNMGNNQILNVSKLAVGTDTVPDWAVMALSSIDSTKIAIDTTAETGSAQADFTMRLLGAGHYWSFKAQQTDATSSRSMFRYTKAGYWYDMYQFQSDTLNFEIFPQKEVGAPLDFGQLEVNGDVSLIGDRRLGIGTDSPETWTKITAEGEVRSRILMRTTGTGVTEAGFTMLHLDNGHFWRFFSQKSGSDSYGAYRLRKDNAWYDFIEMRSNTMNVEIFPQKDVNATDDFGDFIVNGDIVITGTVDGVDISGLNTTVQNLDYSDVGAAPSIHSHDWTEINNTPAYTTRWPSWGEVTAKPTEFTPEAHNHDGRYYTETEVDGLINSIDTYTDDDVNSLLVGGNNVTLDYSGGSLTINANVGSTGAETLAELSDTDLTQTALASNQVLMYNGTVWINGQLPSSALNNDEGFITTAHLTWNNVSGKPDTATRWPTWTEVTDKPDFGTMAERDVTISTSQPTGGSDGDIWLVY